MSSPAHDFDWHQFVDETRDEKRPADTRQRLRWILALYAVALAIVLVRAVELELSGGDAFRQWAARPLEKVVMLPATRGRILARDGTLLAADRKARALCVHYRYLETPPDPRWLRRQARRRLARAELRDPRRIAAAEDAVRAELADLHHRLAGLCQLGDSEWQARTGRIQRRVSALAETVNRRRLERYRDQSDAESDDAPLGVLAILAGLFAPPERLPPFEVIVAEQTVYHRIVDDLPPEVAETIEDHADAYPGVKIVDYTRRTYPLGPVAAHIVGHVARRSGEPIDSTEHGDEPLAVVGRMGIEGSRETWLAGRDGQQRQFTLRRGTLLSTHLERAPRPGRDIVLTLDPKLQRFAEQLLDRFARRDDKPAEPLRSEPGGAIVVMDIHSGEILTAAAEPRFDPNWFAMGDARLATLLGDPRRPLFDRATKMAIPPGSVFKPLVAVALVEHGVVDPERPFHCQGYLDGPDSMRCQVFRHHGVGHGDVTLAGALAVSCNVYFFQHATTLGAERLVDWARRFGFGRPGATDLASDTTGHLPTAAELNTPSQLQLFAIGQGAFTATPLEVVGMYAAIANGGHLVHAQITRDSVERAIPLDPPASGGPAAQSRIAGLDAATLAAVGKGLRRVVDDVDGTAYHSVRLPGLPIAGKTGTAETGGGQADHAWFAGYVPADAPRWAFVVALEHGGSGAEAAGTMARRLVQRMRQLGYFPPAITADKESFPPGKG